MRDADEVFQCITPAVTRFMSWNPPTIDDYRLRCEALSRADERTEVQFVIRRKDTGACLGLVGVERLCDDIPELGIWMKEAAHGHGYGREAIEVVARWASRTWNKDGLIYPVATENIASRRIAEGLGGQIVAERAGPKYNSVVYRFPSLAHSTRNGLPDLSTVELRRCRSKQDFLALLAFCSTATLARAPLRPTWHPGDLVWRLRGQFDQASALYAVVKSSSFVGILLFHLEDLLFDVVPGDASLMAWLLDAAIEKGRTAGSIKLRIEADDNDTERQLGLCLAGFSRCEAGAVHFHRDLVVMPPLSRPVDGFHLRDCVGTDPEARAQVHRVAWSALQHLGINAASSFSADQYLSLATGGTYDPRLDIVAETTDGRLVANALAWADPASGTAVFEPVGVHPEFRGAGLAAAVISEAMVRLTAQGIGVARVATAHFNTSAVNAYAKLFDRAGTTSIWSRAL